MKKGKIFIANIVKCKNYTIIKKQLSTNLVHKIMEQDEEIIKENAIFIERNGYFIDIDDINSSLDLLIEDYIYVCHNHHIFPIYNKNTLNQNNKSIDIIDNYFGESEFNENISVSKLKKKILFDKKI